MQLRAPGQRETGITSTPSSSTGRTATWRSRSRHHRRSASRPAGSRLVRGICLVVRQSALRPDRPRDHRGAPVGWRPRASGRGCQLGPTPANGRASASTTCSRAPSSTSRAPSTATSWLTLSGLSTAASGRRGRTHASAHRAYRLPQPTIAIAAADPGRPRGAPGLADPFYISVPMTATQVTFDDCQAFPVKAAAARATAGRRSWRIKPSR